MSRRIAAIAAIFALVLVLSAPALGQPSTETLTVFAAASLTDAFEEIARSFEAAHPGVDVVFNFANSATLATQIAEGAPADVFASANTKQMDVAAESGRVASEIRTFAHNRLVVIVPADNPAGIETLHDLANPGLQLILVASGVPARDYSEAMLERMSDDPEFGDTFGAAVLANLVSEEETVRQVTAKVALGEADAGIVYVSDVTPDLRDQVETLTIPDAFNTIAQYPIAVINDSPVPDLATAFVNAVLSNDGQRVIEAWGLIGVCQPYDPAEATPEPADAGATPEATPDMTGELTRPMCD